MPHEAMSQVVCHLNMACLRGVSIRHSPHPRIDHLEVSHLQISADVVAAFTPTGVLRASINLGNPILASRGKGGEAAVGVSVDLATKFAELLGVELELVVFDAAKKSVEALGNGQADIGFFAIDPARGEEIAFTDAYVLIEGCYLVNENSPITSNEEVDRRDHTVAVGQGSAYDLYLSREIEKATIVRAQNSQAVVDTFVAQHLDVAAGVKQQLQADAQRHRCLRLLPGHFMVIKQAMGVPKSRGSAAAEVLHQFVEQMKASNFVSEALKRHEIQGAAVAPPYGSTPDML
jgi:polar amino acid transport system substrate-binding protein